MSSMRFYDEVCPAHNALKATILGQGLLTEKPLIVYFSGKPQIG